MRKVSKEEALKDPCPMSSEELLSDWEGRRQADKWAPKDIFDFWVRCFEASGSIQETEQFKSLFFQN